MENRRFITHLVLEKMAGGLGIWLVWMKIEKWFPKFYEIKTKNTSLYFCWDYGKKIHIPMKHKNFLWLFSRKNVDLFQHIFIINSSSVVSSKASVPLYAVVLDDIQI